MGLFRKAVASTVLLASSTMAQVATYQNGGHALSVNIPSDSASSGQGPIYFQISAPSGTSWVSFGQGSRMAGSNMFVVYARDSTNVTISGRAGTGHSMPQHDSDIQLTLLEGSGITSDGSMVANVRCDNCHSWSGGSMSFTDSSSSWIYASRSGNALNSDDVGASISQHNSDTSFSMDLTQGTGGSSSNPFFAVAAASPSESASATGSAASETARQTQTTAATSAGGTVSTPTGGVSNPVASTGATSGSSGSTSSSAESTDNTSTLLSAHGIIMSLLFLGMFPFFSLTLYLKTTKKVRYIHAPLQALSVILLIIGMALGIVLGQRIGELDGYHMIIGFIVVAMLVLFQPAMGIYQHLHYHKTGGKTVFGMVHRWLGRTMIMLGIVDGGLGYMIAGNTAAYIPYAIVAAIVFLVYVSVLGFAWYRSGQPQDVQNEKAGSDRSYEMQNPRGPQHQRLASDPVNTNNQSMYQQQSTQPKAGYTISSRR